MTRRHSKTDFDLWLAIRLNAYKNRARSNDMPFTLSITEFADFILGMCRYCGAGPKSVSRAGTRKGKFRANGIDRIVNDFGYVQDNCVTCCIACNRAKSDMSLSEFTDWLKRAYHRTILDVCL